MHSVQSCNCVFDNRVVKLWRESLSKVNQKAAESLADPTEYENLFPGLKEAFVAEQYLRESCLGKTRPASDYPLITVREQVIIILFLSFSRFRFYVLLSFLLYFNLKCLVKVFKFKLYFQLNFNYQKQFLIIFILITKYRLCLLFQDNLLLFTYTGSKQFFRRYKSDLLKSNLFKLVHIVRFTPIWGYYNIKSSLLQHA